MRNAAIASVVTLFAAAAGCGIDATVFTQGDPAVIEDDGRSSTSSNTTDGQGGAGSIAVGVGGEGTTVTVGQGGASMTTTTGGGMGGSPPTFTLQCGGQVCPGGGVNACCWDNFEQNPGPQAVCVNGPPNNDMCFTDPAQQGGFETRIECQRPSDCGPGLECCANRRPAGNGSYYDEVTCEASCAFPDIRLCENEQDSANCPQLPLSGNQTVQGECQDSELLPDGYLICGYP